jgi:hypothetical protein
MHLTHLSVFADSQAETNYGKLLTARLWKSVKKLKLPWLCKILWFLKNYGIILE